jgi:hypothetical protein
MWVDAGRPQSGELCKIKTVCSLNYKNAIRQALYDFEHSFDDELYEHFLCKEPTDFWKCWNKKFKRQASHNEVINGLHNSADIAQEFAKSFSETFCSSVEDSIAKN